MILQELIVGNKRKDRTPLRWTPIANDAFERCKRELAYTTLLAHPVAGAKLVIYVDASDTAVGAALHQRIGDELQPLAFYSKKLTATQQKYSTYDRELTAIYQAVCHFRYMVEGRSCYIVTDHRPLTFAFQQKLEKASPRRIRQLDFISQFTTDIRFTPGSENISADALSRIETIKILNNACNLVDYCKIACAQQTDAELQLMLQTSSNPTNSLQLKHFSLPGCNSPLICDTSTSRIRPYIPSDFRHQIMSTVHNLSHPGVRSTTKLLSSRYIWPAIRRDAAVFVRNCVQCQRAKIHRHTMSAPVKYAPPKERFEHINIDIVGPFPICEGQRYCLTIIDRFTRWPEAIPIPDMSAEVVAKALLAQWISRFGVPARISSDRGRQFESSVFTELMQTIGTTHLHTTPYHPQSNGIIERWHRTLKAAILCHEPSKWVHHLPTILLGMRVTFKPDLNASPAELVYGTTLTIPGEFLNSTKPPHTSSAFVTEFRTAMQKLQPTDTAHHTPPSTFVSKNLQSSTHVFIRNDSIRPSLTHPYTGPYPVLNRFPKFFTILVRGRPNNISIDRLKPAFLSNSDATDNPTTPVNRPRSSSQLYSSPGSLETQQGPNQTKPSPMRTSTSVTLAPKSNKQKTTSSGRSVRLPIRFT